MEVHRKEVELIEPELIKGVIPIELGQYAHNRSGHPSNELYVIGITGTNGKTTVTYLKQLGTTRLY